MNRGTFCSVTVENHGSLILFRPKRRAAEKWLQENTDGQWFGGALVVEPRYACDLAAGLQEAGFNVGGAR